MEGFVKFLGTGGARFVVSRQIRATGGLWLKYKETNLYIDPGPGALVRMRASREKFDPITLDGIILTHKHIDHANDVNAMIEAMTDGGFRKKGVLFCPGDALNGDGDSIVLKYVRGYLEDVVTLQEQRSYRINDVTFVTPVRHRHPVETYGIIFELNKTVGLIADTKYFEGLPEFYRCNILIINVLRSKPIKERDPIHHLAIEDVIKIVASVKPEMAILTHFGMNLLQEKPHLIAKKLEDLTGVNIIAAYDGMKLEL